MLILYTCCDLDPSVNLKKQKTTSWISRRVHPEAMRMNTTIMKQSLVQNQQRTKTLTHRFKPEVQPDTNQSPRAKTTREILNLFRHQMSES
jgi:hypothetical protein